MVRGRGQATKRRLNVANFSKMPQDPWQKNWDRWRTSVLRPPTPAYQGDGVTDALATPEILLFEGTAREAALLFPQNLNVALTIALAVGGIDALKVRVVADPNVKRNSHEIEIESAAGRASFFFENTPSATNPKTSAVTALSIVQAVKERLDIIRPLNVTE